MNDIQLMFCDKCDKKNINSKLSHPNSKTPIHKKRNMVLLLKNMKLQNQNLMK